MESDSNTKEITKEGCGQLDTFLLSLQFFFSEILLRSDTVKIAMDWWTYTFSVTR